MILQRVYISFYRQIETIKQFRQWIKKLKIQQNEVLLGKKATNPISCRKTAALNLDASLTINLDINGNPLQQEKY